MQNSHVSVVIPSFNGRGLFAKHLDSVLASLRDGDEVIIVDDASTDDSVPWLVKKFSLESDFESDGWVEWEGQYSQASVQLTVKVISNKTNLRFGKSVNRGVLRAQHPLIFLLNNDVSPEPDVLEHLLPHFATHSVFAVGCKEIEDNGQVGGKNELWFERGLFMHKRADDFSAGETAWVSGGSGLFHKQKWLALGGFSPDYYPAYWEDVDLSFRAQAKGWKTLFEPNAVVHHHHESTNKDVFGKQQMERISWRNAKRFVKNNATLPQLIQFIFWQPYWTYQQLRNKH